MARLLAISLLALAAPGQTSPKSPGPHRMEIVLERLEGQRWRAVDPGRVFEQGEHVRFRFRTNFEGYLYVTNQSTSGQYTLLFPREETGRQNRITPDKEYLVPATKAWFRIAGPPGHEVVYWLMSPVELGLTLPPAPKSPPAHALTPRCDDSIWRARGDCVDSSAGPRAVAVPDDLPEPLAGIPGAASRELVIMREQNSSTVSSPAPLRGPVIYEFRIAHR